tara:strand:+ start:320 stop:454 length:135 start_codon:yes stop_codon:yes gene_type:complete
MIERATTGNAKKDSEYEFDFSQTGFFLIDFFIRSENRQKKTEIL